MRLLLGLAVCSVLVGLVLYAFAWLVSVFPIEPPPTFATVTPR